MANNNKNRRIVRPAPAASVSAPPAPAAKEKEVRGPRDRYYIFASFEQKKLEAVRAETLEEAKEKFEAEHDCSDAVSLAGDPNKQKGWYIALGTGPDPASRISVTLSARQLMAKTGKSWEGQFAGFNVVGNGIAACTVEGKSYEDDELISLDFEEKVDPNSNVSKPKLKKHEVIHRDQIDNCRQY